MQLGVVWGEGHGVPHLARPQLNLFRVSVGMVDMSLSVLVFMGVCI